METKLNLIAEIAVTDGKCKFNNLIHLLNEDGLKECFYQLKKGRATGVDNVTLEEYELHLDANLEDLVARMKRFSYRPQAVKRVYIPKANGKLRPLGIPAIEDKIVQMGIARILTAIYEADFLDFSYGFRPGRSCHDALDRLDKIIMKHPINHVIDADIKGFFDNVNHDWLLRCLQERISDKKLLRYIVRFLKAGVMEEGKWQMTDKGTPQGGIISPILANIYLHYVLDLWVERVVKHQSRGMIAMVRYADDFVICVQYKDEAEWLLVELRKRLEKFGLELAVDKTKIIGFGRFAVENASNKGQRAGTFNFLGFTHFCDKTRTGKFKVGRTTDRKRFRAKMKEMNNWLKSIRNLVPVKDWWPILCAKLRGHFQYYGVSGNFRGIERFYYLTKRLIFKWINRRSQKKSFNWERFQEYVIKYPLPIPKIYHDLYTLYSY